MFHRLRIPILLIICSALFWAGWFFVLPWALARIDLANDETANFIQSLDSLINLLSVLVQIGSWLWALSLFRKPATTAADKVVALSPITGDLIRSRRPQGSKVNWIDRGATGPNRLRAAQRLVLVGPSGQGKTREAAELMLQAVHADLVTTQLYEPGQEFRFLADDSLRQAIRQQLDPTQPALLFIDDLPYHFQNDEQLTKLSLALSTIAACKNGGYFVATARSDQLMPVHAAWLRQENVETVALPDLTAAQVGQLVDNASGAFHVRLNQDARQLFIENETSLPELLIASLLEFKNNEVVDSAAAQQVLTATLAAGWAAAKRTIISRHLAAAYLLDALAHFHMAGVNRYTPLVFAYAQTLWASQQFNPIRKQAALQAALQFLHHYDIVDSEGQLFYPDRIVEGVITAEAAHQALIQFLTHHRRWLRHRWLRRLYRNREFHRWALFDLARQSPDQESIYLYTLALQINPHFGYYYNRGIARRDQGDLTGAIEDYTQAIILNPQYVGAYINRGNVRRDQEDLTGAVEDYTQAITLNPQDAVAYNNRGVVRREQGDVTGAIEDLTQAITFDPQYAQSYYNRGNARRDQGDLAGAIEDYNQALSLNPNDIATWMGLAATARHLQDVDTWQSASEKARSLLEPTDLYNASCLESVAGNPDRALALLADAKAAGKLDQTWAWQDPDLDWIRDDPRFAEIVGNLDEKHV